MIGVEINHVDWSTENRAKLRGRGKQLKRPNVIRHPGLSNEFNKDVEGLIRRLKAIKRAVLVRPQRSANRDAGGAEVRAYLEDDIRSQRESESVEKISSAPR